MIKRLQNGRSQKQRAINEHQIPEKSRHKMKEGKVFPYNVITCLEVSYSRPEYVHQDHTVWLTYILITTLYIEVVQAELSLTKQIHCDHTNRSVLLLVLLSFIVTKSVD